MRHPPLSESRPESLKQARMLNNVRWKGHKRYWVNGQMFGFRVLTVIFYGCFSEYRTSKSCMSFSSKVAFWLISITGVVWVVANNFCGDAIACSAGVFFERAICSRKRHVETSRREEEMGRVNGSGEGAGREKRKLFSPFPLPPFLLSSSHLP